MVRWSRWSIRNPTGLPPFRAPDDAAPEVTAAALAAAGAINAGEADLDACADDQGVVRSIARAAADALLGDARLLDIPQERWSRLQQQTWLDARRALGDVLDLIDGGWPAEREPARVVADAVSALGQAANDRQTRPALVLYGVDSLLEVPRSRFTDAGEMLWAMRSAAQAAPQVILVFAGGPAAIELTGEPDAAFFGWGPAAGAWPAGPGDPQRGHQ